MSAQDALERFVHDHPLFSALSAEDVPVLLRAIRPVELTAGQILFREGEPGTAMWILGDGAEVSVTGKPTEAGRKIALAYARSGEAVGEMALLDGGPRSGTAVVVQSGIAFLISADELDELRRTRAPAAYKVLRKLCADLCRKLRRTSDRIVASTGQAPMATALPQGEPARPSDLETFGPFAALDDAGKKRVLDCLTRVTLEPITPVFGEGEQGDAAFFVVDGEVTVGRNGKTLASLGRGSAFGVVAVVDGMPRSASCLTATQTTLLRLGREQFDVLFAQQSPAAFELLEVVARQLVAHLRVANELLSISGPTFGPRPRQEVKLDLAPRGPLPELSPAARRLIEAKVLPLDLELDLDGLPA